MSDHHLLKNEDRTRCENWSRVMGYMRPTSFWNPGKQAEWEERKMYKEPSIEYMNSYKKGDASK